MWVEPPYFNDILDKETPGVDKYIELVSTPDMGNDTQEHHIVPVAYFKDILGRTDCRKEGSPDKNPVNLVRLSRGRHVLAHFYLAKYAKPCIAVQMRNAFCQSYQTTDFSKVTEKEVLDRIDELNAEYQKLKCAKKEHKDGVEIRRTRACVSLTNWKDGRKVGVSARWTPEGILRGIVDNDTGDTFTCVSWKDHAYGFMLDGRPCGNTGYDLHIDARDYMAGGSGHAQMRGYLRVYYGGSTLEMIDNGEYGFIVNSYPGKIFYDNEGWEQAKTFLQIKSLRKEVLSAAIRSIRNYADMLGIGFSESYSDMLSRLEECTLIVEPLHSYDVPEFPGPGNGYGKVKILPGWKMRRIDHGQKSLTRYENGVKTHGFILKPDGTVRRYSDYMHGFVTDEYAGFISIFSFNGIIIAKTDYRLERDTNTNEYEPPYHNVPGIRVNGDMSMCSIIGVFTFKSIIEKFYPDYVAHFDTSWEQKLCQYRQMFPDIEPAGLPDIPVTL